MQDCTSFRGFLILALLVSGLMKLISWVICKLSSVKVNCSYKMLLRSYRSRQLYLIIILLCHYLFYFTIFLVLFWYRLVIVFFLVSLHWDTLWGNVLLLAPGFHMPDLSMLIVHHFLTCPWVKCNLYYFLSHFAIQRF